MGLKVQQRPLGTALNKNMAVERMSTFLTTINSSFLNEKLWACKSSSVQMCGRYFY